MRGTWKSVVISSLRCVLKLKPGLLVDHLDADLLLHPHQVLAGDAVLRRRFVVVGAELFLQRLVVAARLLLLAQLDPVLGLAHAPAPVLTRRIGAALDPAFVGEAALALEEELLALSAALLA